MNITWYDLGQLSAGTIIDIGLRGTEANVVLLDPSNFARYRAEQSFDYADGGHFKQSPARLRAPHAGHWYVAVDLGGLVGSVESWIIGVHSVAA
jgi:hypothetical protein